MHIIIVIQSIIITLIMKFIVGTLRLHTYQLDSSDNYIPNNVKNSETTCYNNPHTTNDSIIYTYNYIYTCRL